MTKRVGGRITVSINGQTWPLRGSFSVIQPTSERRPVVGQDRVHGYVETQGDPELRGEVRLVHGLTRDDLLLIAGQLVIIELANGQNFAFKDPWIKRVGEAQDDRCEIHLGGAICEAI